MEALELIVRGPIEYIYKGRTKKFDDSFELMLALPIYEKSIPLTVNKYIEQPEHYCVSTDFTGSIPSLPQAWENFYHEVNKHNFTINDDNIAREVYKDWISLISEKSVTELQININR